MSARRSLGALLRKELAVIWPGLAIGLPLCLLQAVTFLMWAPASYVAYLASVTLAVAVAGTFVDSRFRTEPLFASLPIRRATAVAARYLWCALVIAVMLLLAFGEARLISAFADASPALLHAGLIGAEEAVAFLLLTAVPLALFLPFSFRWGPSAGAARFGPAVGVVAALGAALILATGSNAGELARAAASGAEELVGRIGATPVLLATILCLTAAGVASGILSARIYARRDV